MKSALKSAIKKALKRVVPGFCVDCYHLFTAVIAAMWYRHPSRELRVIGVTGTNGKSTVTDYVARILEEAGHTVGYTSTVKFKIGKVEW
ncbi:Mur ligase family protein [Patescibacteria group bacterium]